MKKYKRVKDKGIIKQNNIITMNYREMYLDCEYYIVNELITYFRKFDYSDLLTIKDNTTYATGHWDDSLYSLGER